MSYPQIFAVFGRFRVTKCDKAVKERRTLLITDSNGSVPPTPMEARPNSRNASESQQVVGNTKPFGSTSLQRKLNTSGLLRRAVAANAR